MNDQYGRGLVDKPMSNIESVGKIPTPSFDEVKTLAEAYSYLSKEISLCEEYTSRLEEIISPILYNEQEGQVNGSSERKETLPPALAEVRCFHSRMDNLKWRLESMMRRAAL